MTVRMFPTALAANYANPAGLVTEPSVTQLTGGVQRAYSDTLGVLPAPAQAAASTVGSGGTFAAGTYFYKVTAINLAGETLPSNEQSIATALDGSNTINWSPVPGATGYRIYRGTATNGENVYYTAAANAVSFTDTNGASTAGTPPATNTAVVVLDVPGNLDGIASGDAAMLVNAGYVAIGLSGTTTLRPPTSNLNPGTLYVDTTLNIVVFWDGANWRNVVTGATA
jgi:hypothetical protein